MVMLTLVLVVAALALAAYPLIVPTTRPLLYWAVILLCLAILLGQRLVVLP